MLLNLAFLKNTVLSCFFLLFSIISLYFLISTVMGQISNSTVELIIPIGLPNKDAKSDIPVTTETKKWFNTI